MLENKSDNLHEDADGKEQEHIQEETSAEEVGQNTIVEAETEDDDDHEKTLNEIDESNAEDAEDEGHKDRHEIPMLDYHSMSMEALVEELDQLISTKKIQAIKAHVDAIKSEFDMKFQELLEEKKEDFIEGGGNEIDFHFTTPVKRRFNECYSTYKSKRNEYYKNLEHRLNENLQKRLDIIEELKGLINVEENINETYKHFKELQDKWRNAGPVPRVNYNDVWRTYHHHVEIFYDFLDLNRDLRDLDFKHNLEEKQKLIERAEGLANEGDINKAFRELQNLHKIWKEEIGPVDREHREDVWNRFSAATKTIHKKRQEFFKNQEAAYEDNLKVKEAIISKIEAIADKPAKNHNLWQKQIKEIEALREQFFRAGKVPYKVNEKVWANFKNAVRRFNRNKNAFYKNLKKEQHKNLEQKLELVALAESLKDNEDWNETTPIMKKIQSDWKKIGHVPRKHSDKIWADFKAACNHYFDKLHARKNKDFEAENEAFNKKKAYMEEIKVFELSGEQENDLEQVKAIIEKWKSLGRVPHNKKSIESKFNKIVDALFRKMNIDRKEAEMIKYGNKLQSLADADNDNLIRNERIFIRKRIDEVKNEIRQLENNLQFINADDDNPIVKEVRKNIQAHKEDLAIWKAKLTELRSI